MSGFVDIAGADTSTRRAFVEIVQLAKSFGSTPVLRGVSLDVAEGEVLALLGPSGSGKTTLLRLLAGFEEADAGSIRLGGTDVTRMPPARRGVGMVFQHYALFPHLDVGENVAFGLHGRGLSREESAHRVAEVLALVDLAGYERRAVSALSGGQQQRVALARALAPAPRLLLLDEPLSNLDPTLRERTRRKLQEVLRRLGITTVLVTHEQEEAFDLAQRVAVLWGGELQQVGAPEELHERPANRTVAGFVGRANFLRGRLRRSAGDGWEVAFADGVAWPGELVAALPPLQEGDEAELMLRPESLAFVAPGTENALAGRVVERRYAGATSRFRVEAPGGLEVEVVAPSGAARVDEDVAVAPGGAGPRGRIWAAPESSAAAATSRREEA
ncbi:MAG TPA: ABC transporter ATP-binding protein [Thermoanaerobaculia bacterium]|nr:ABC transporter ATP-binding protein [Thermoanaerobaculia bacterium]